MTRSASRMNTVSTGPPKNAETAPTVVAMKTETIAATMPNMKAARLLNMSWESTSLPSESVPSRCRADGAAGCSVTAIVSPTLSKGLISRAENRSTCVSGSVTSLSGTIVLSTTMASYPTTGS